MAQEIEKLLEKGGPPGGESLGGEEEKEPTVEVRCPKCKNKIEVPLSKLFFATDTQISAVCPKCGLTMLDKKDSTKVIEAFKQHGVYEEKRRLKEKKKGEEEELTDFELLGRFIDQSFEGLKISEQDKAEIMDWFSMYQASVQDWFEPNMVQWVTSAVDFMLRQRSYAQKTITKAVGRLSSKMQLEMTKRQRERAITTMFQQSGMLMQPQQQIQPMMSPMMPNIPQMGPIPGVMQPPIPGMQPPVQQPMQPGVASGVQPQQQPQQPQQQTSPEVVQLMKEIQELKSKLEQQVEKEEPEEVVEEVLDESGKPVKRIIKVRGGVREKSPHETLTETLNLLKDIGVVKSPGEIYAELKASGVIPDMGVIKEIIDSVSKKQESPLDMFAPQNEEIKALKDELEALREQLREEKTERMLTELQAKYEEKLKDYELMLQDLKKEVSTKRYEGKPESVQELEVRKEVLSEISKDLKEMFKTVFEGVVEPMAEAQRMDRLMLIKMKEEAGQLPPGTFQKIIGEQKKPKKENLEEVKERLKKIRKSRK